MIRRCRTCNKNLSIAEFNLSGKGNHKYECKKCQKVYYDANREKILAQRRKRFENEEYRKADQEKRKKYRLDNYPKLMLIYSERNARLASVPFNLTAEDVIVPDVCPVFGTKFSYESKRNDRDLSPSIDRIIPEKGYVKGNVWIISFRANRIKSDATLDELRMIVKALEAR